MEEKVFVQELVKELTENEKVAILKDLSELELQQEIKELLIRMYPRNFTEITHGSNEYGNDLVMVTPDSMGDKITGIVVKTGDIRGTSLGTVDKIVSQVNQAFAHPVSLKGYKLGADTYVTFLNIIVCGTFSNNADIRLTAELNKPVVRNNWKILDQQWLTNNFTTFYPHVFYEGQVSQYIENTLNSLE